MNNNNSGWIIVVFNEDNSVDAVPNIWLKKNSCAWPKSKNVKKYIENHIKPNNIDLTFTMLRN